MSVSSSCLMKLSYTLEKNTSAQVRFFGARTFQIIQFYLALHSVEIKSHLKLQFGDNTKLMN